MTQEQLDRIFDRFYRATEDRTNPGSGLGLSIVKSLVELHDGRIEVTSKPGGGTTFAIMIPAVKQQTGPVIDSFEALRGRDVLVVDDEREIAQLIADQLAPFGVRATIAAGGAEALELLSRERFDAVTLDVKMPELDGVAVLRQIRAIPGLAQIPVVFVSVFSDRADLAGEWIVSKPIDAEELRAVLSSAVRAGRSHALVVARDSLRPSLEASLQGLQIDHTWESSGIGAARACSERRFEVALIDVGLPNPHAVLQALDLRGRRDRRAVILFTDGITPVPHDISRLGLEVVPLAHAARSLRDALEPKAADGEPV
jgi:CheY-like chemotaxis protein